MKKALVLILIVIAVSAIVIGSRKDDSSPQSGSQTNSDQVNSNQSTTSPTPVSDPNVKTYTMEEVRKHGPQSWDNGDSSPLCWMVIHDKVYEIPDNFIETHPGGHVIYEGCGLDATTYFETRPQGTGTPHSTDARAILEKYYIGDLKK